MSLSRTGDNVLEVSSGPISQKRSDIGASGALTAVLLPNDFLFVFLNISVGFTGRYHFIAV